MLSRDKVSRQSNLERAGNRTSPGARKELPADYPPLEFGFLPGDTDEYIVTSDRRDRLVTTAGLTFGNRRLPGRVLSGASTPGSHDAA